MSARDLPALEAEKPEGQRLHHFPPFVAPGAEPSPMPAGAPLRLVAVAMMRDGDKLASYRALAEALTHLNGDWRLTIVGDGEARASVEAAMARFGRRVTFLGQVDDRGEMRAALDAAHVFVWPGVGEAFGMAYLEAQAAGRPVVAEDRPGVRDVVGPSGRMTPPGAPEAFAAAISALAANYDALRKAGDAARGYVLERHGVDAAAGRLGRILREVAPW